MGLNMLKKKKITTSDPSEKLAARGIFKKRWVGEPTHVTQLVWLLRLYFYVEDPLPISEILSSTFFFFFGHFPIQVSQRPERQKELTCWAASYISALLQNHYSKWWTGSGCTKGKLGGIIEFHFPIVIQLVKCISRSLNKMHVLYSINLKYFVTILKTVGDCQSTRVTNRLLKRK